MESNESEPTGFETFVTPWNERVSLVIIYSALCALGLITNGIAIALTLFTDLRQHRVNILIANLAVCDFMLVGVFVSGQNFYILYREDMPATGCTWLALFNYIATVQEVVSAPVLATNRYITFYHRKLYDKVYTKRNTALLICATWLICTSISLIFMSRMEYDHRNEHCCVVVEGNTRWTIIYWVIIIVPLCGGCDTTMVFCNWKIYKKLSDHGTTKGAALKTNVVTENREILYFMIIDMMMPICTHSVYHVCKFAVPNRFSFFSRVIFSSLNLGNAGLRGMVILIMLRPYRNAFKRCVLRWNPSSVTPSTNTNTQQNCTSRKEYEA